MVKFEYFNENVSKKKSPAKVKISKKRFQHTSFKVCVCVEKKKTINKGEMVFFFVCFPKDDGDGVYYY